MKHFGLGLLLGATAGLLASFLKDENGERVGAPLKHEVEGLKDDAQHLATGLNKAKKASAELRQNMPVAQRAISDIETEVSRYQDHTDRIVKNMEYQTRQINAKVSDDDKKN